MDEEDQKFEKYQQLMAKRNEMRAVILEAVDMFNAFQDRELPYQFQKAVLAFKDRHNTIREAHR